MKVSLLGIQQYIGVHPLLKEDQRVKENYLVLLKYFAEKVRGYNLWSKQVLKLYSEFMLGTETDFDEKTIINPEHISKNKVFKYRYMLLTDCLFIQCFDNSERGEELLDYIVEFYGKRYKRKLLDVFDAFYSTEDGVIIDDISYLKRVYKIIWNDRKFLEKDTKKIMITANMSAGKSTLLNALAGKKINKTQNDTCTAKIHTIHNKSGEDGLNYEWDRELELNASFDVLMDDNIKNTGLDIHVGTRFRSIGKVNTKVCFIDTPGVNSSMDKSHREISDNAIQSKKNDILIYLFNAENIGSDDDLKHLKYVKENYSGNIIFVINRLDRFKKGIDSVEQTVDTVRSDLEKLGFDNPEVYPISAYAAYLAKMVLYNEQLSEDELDDLELLKRRLKKEEFSYEKYYPNYSDIKLKGKMKEEKELLLHSGILSLENILYL